MNWPTIPENLSDLTAAELRALAAEIRSALTANLSVAESAEDFAAFDRFEQIGRRVSSLADTVEAEETAAAEAEAAETAAAEAAEVEPEVEEVV